MSAFVQFGYGTVAVICGRRRRSARGLGSVGRLGDVALCRMAGSCRNGARAGAPRLRLAVFTLGWTLMVVAMMLPATLLLLWRCVGDQPFAMGRLGPVILAYLAIWIVFGCYQPIGVTACSTNL